MGVREVLILFILFISVNSYSQSWRDSAEIIALIYNENRRPLKGVQIVVEKNKKVIAYGITDSVGRVDLKMLIDRSKIAYGKICFVYDGQMKVGAFLPFSWSYTLLHEYFLNDTSCYDPVDYDILFKARTDTLRDEKDLFLLKELMERFPNMEVDLKGCYKFNETEIIAYQRIRKVKAKVRELEIDSSRLNYSVMDRDYVSYDIKRNCDTIFYNGDYLYNANVYHVSRYNDKYQAVEVDFNFKTVRNEEE